jgi:hypothetical protein
MPTKDQHTCSLSCRISQRLEAKLNSFTDATGRSRSDVLRWLLLQPSCRISPKAGSTQQRKNGAYRPSARGDSRCQG